MANTKYDYDPNKDLPQIDYSELVTVPDQVLTMYEIYQKYAVRGEIAGLSQSIRPHTTDDLDDFDPAVDFVPEEDVDILQRSHEIRTRRSYSSASGAADSQPGSDPVEPSGPDSDSDVDKNTTKPTPKYNQPDANPDTKPDDSQRSK